MPLPKDILVSRLRNELSQCSKYLKTTLDTTDEKLDTYPVEFDIELHNTPGPVRENGKVVNRYNHRFRIIISSSYPFEKPAVIWKTPIFHPNIMAPEDGGHVCTKLLSEWSFNSTILTFVKGSSRCSWPPTVKVRSARPAARRRPPSSTAAHELYP